MKESKKQLDTLLEPFSVFTIADKIGKIELQTANKLDAFIKGKLQVESLD